MSEKRVHEDGKEEFVEVLEGEELPGEGDAGDGVLAEDQFADADGEDA